jgi:hypothetical protein
VAAGSSRETEWHTWYRASIDKLRKDNLTLKEELYLENKFSITPIDNSASHRITAMQDEADVLTRKVCKHCWQQCRSANANNIQKENHLY